MSLSFQRLAREHEVLQCLEEDDRTALYHVRHRLLGEDRTARVWSPEAADDTLTRRAREASRLAQTNIARVVDFAIEEDGSAWMIVEMVVGADFGEILDAGLPVASPLVVAIGIQISRALGYVHGRGFPLRCLERRSFVLTRSPEDGPLVKLVGVADRLGTFAGTGAGRWSAPEGPEPSVAADVWIAARLLGELSRLGGRSVPDTLRPILERGEARDPEARWPSAGALGRALSETGWASRDALRRPECSIPALLARLRDSGRTRVLHLGESSGEHARPTPAPPDLETVVVPPPPPSGPGSSSVDLQLIESAREARRIGDLDRAAEVLDRALENHPDSQRLARLREEVENERRNLEERSRREKEVRRARSEIEELLDCGDLAAARRRLEEANDSWGPSEALEEMEARADALEEEGRALRTGLLETARAALDEGRFREADSVLDEIESRCPGDSDASKLRSELSRRVLEALEANDAPSTVAVERSASTVAIGPPPPDPPARTPPPPPADASVRSLLDHADQLVSLGFVERALEVLERAREAAPEHEGIRRRQRTLSRLSRLGFSRARAPDDDLRTRPRLEEPADLPEAKAADSSRRGGRDRPVADVTLRGWGFDDGAEAFGAAGTGEGSSGPFGGEAQEDELSLRFSRADAPVGRSGRKRRTGLTRLQWILLALLVAALTGLLGAHLARRDSPVPTTPIELEDVSGPELSLRPFG